MVKTHLLFGRVKRYFSISKWSDIVMEDVMVPMSVDASPRRGFYNNERRRLGKNVTPLLRESLRRRNMQTSTAVRNSRYLKSDPSMVPQMARIESQISTIPVTYIPNSKVAAIESKLKNGDVIAIVSNWHSTYTSHVGLAKREGSTCRFMHASSSRSKGRQCLVDTRISQYLRQKSSHIGITVFRPGEAPLIG